MTIHHSTAAARLARYRGKAWEAAARRASFGGNESDCLDWRPLAKAAARAKYGKGEGATAGAAIREGRKVWIECPADIGLRFVGFSDELPGGPRHTGHYSDVHQEEVCRGAVWQWPARNGESVYVYGWREGSEGRRNGWQDTSTGSDSGAGLLFFGDIVRGDKGGRERTLTGWRDNDSDLRDCARWADSEADSAADYSRDYSEAWQAGSEAADVLQEAQEARRAALALIREARANCQPIAALGPALRAALGRSIESHVEAWQDAKERAAAAWRDCPSSLESAFLEGAGRNRGGLFA